MGATKVTAELTAWNTTTKAAVDKCLDATDATGAAWGGAAGANAILSIKMTCTDTVITITPYLKKSCPGAVSATAKTAFKMLTPITKDECIATKLTVKTAAVTTIDSKVKGIAATFAAGDK